MATNFSKNQVNIANKNFYGESYSEKNFISKNYYKIKKNIEIRKINYTNYFLNIFKKMKLKTNKIETNLNNNAATLNEFTPLQLDLFRNNYNSNGFFYIDNFLDYNFYDNLKKNWPHKSFFYEADTPNKNYSFSFKYCSDKKFHKYMNMKNGEVRNLNYFFFLKKFYAFLINSPKMEKFIKNFTNTNGYKLYSIAASIAKEKSYLIPHFDTVKSDINTEAMLNFIFFIDGADNPIDSGGTGIYSDNEFKTPLLIPKSLKNSAIVYNSKNNFYHGFNIMKKNTFRHAITFQFRLET